MSEYEIDNQKIVLSPDEEAEILKSSPYIQIYKDRITPFRKILGIQEKGILFEMLLDFSETREFQVCPDSTENANIINAAFENIYQGMEIDRPKYIKRTLRSRINGKKGGRPSEQVNPQKPTGTQNNPVGSCGNPEKPYTDKDKDTDTDKYTDKDKDKGTGKDCQGNPVYETLEDAYKVFNTFCMEYGVNGQNKNIILSVLQKQYGQGECSQYNDLKAMAEQSEVVCKEIIQNRAFYEIA